MSPEMRASVGAAIIVLVAMTAADGSAQRRRARGVRRAVAGDASARYQRARERWHRPVATPPGFRAMANPPVRLRMIHGGREVVLQPVGSSGRFAASTLARAETVLADHRGGHSRAIDRRLLELVYRTAVHFGVPLVHVVSCVRSPRAGSHSNHHVGRAIDFALPGVSDDRVADHVRRFGFVGVGLYPRSGFTHLDVRDRSYFWVDHSGPGERGRARQVLAELAREVDRRARRDGTAMRAPGAIEAMMPARPLLDPDAPEIFEVVASESDVVDPVLDDLEHPVEPIETLASEAPADDDTADVATSEPADDVTGGVTAAAVTPDAAEEAIVEPRRMPEVPRRLRWRAGDRSPRTSVTRLRRRR